MLTTTSGVVIGGLVGQAYNGSITPLAFSFGVLGACSVVVVFVTEGGKMFRNTHSTAQHAGLH